MACCHKYSTHHEDIPGWAAIRRFSKVGDVAVLAALGLISIDRFFSRGEPFPAKFRNSLERPEPMIPGKLTRIAFEIPDIAHVFRKGHKIMVQIQSSWFPLVDRNPQVFVDIPWARPEDFQKATQRVSRSKKASSSTSLLVMESGEGR